MYFAADIPHTAQCAGHVERLVARDPALAWSALVDGAFDYGMPQLAGFDQRRPSMPPTGMRPS